MMGRFRRRHEIGGGIAPARHRGRFVQWGPPRMFSDFVSEIYLLLLIENVFAFMLSLLSG